VNPAMRQLWENYLNSHLKDNWQAIGTVANKQSQLKILTEDNKSLINVKIDDINIIWNRAIESRLKI
jgi:phosphoribosylformylglycinamidine synthase